MYMLSVGFFPAFSCLERPLVYRRSEQQHLDVEIVDVASLVCLFVCLSLRKGVRQHLETFVNC